MTADGLWVPYSRRRPRVHQPRYRRDCLGELAQIDGISSIEAANAWLDTFIADFNRRFARPAKYPKDLHRPAAESSEELDDIFAWQELRKLSSKHDRSKKMPKRRAQARVQEQLRIINPVLVNPKEFRASLKR